MKTPYSHRYAPVAPVLTVRLAVPDASPQSGVYQALIDTGADGTFIPTAILEALTLPILYTTNARAYIGGTRHQVAVYEVDILFETNRIPSIDVVADDWGDEIILGRNVLNKLQMFLNGPQGITEIRW